MQSIAARYVQLVTLSNADDGSLVDRTLSASLRKGPEEKWTDVADTLISKR